MSETIDLPSPDPYQSRHLANVAAAMREVSQPESIGPYRIESVIGRGGMGIVYRAEQLEPIRRTVALKVIKIGMDTEQVMARFQSERQAVALMNHPNVARVLDAGATDTGRPYFVMEYVAGETITAFADGHRLPIRQRLELFVQACQAVEHAHQKAIIHRDLKPSNILVTTTSPDEPGTVKVIDFGLAKAIGPAMSDRIAVTETGQLLGTPEYMSPEQADAAGDTVDTRTDVYSLGVVLYELLSGVLPFDPETLRASSWSRLQQIIREVDPPSPADGLSRLGEKADDVARKRQLPLKSLSVQLDGELKWIVLKALRKEPDERYATATELADDVRRYIDHQPLRAGPTTIGYRVRKFLRRNRGGVAAAGLVAAALIAGIAGTTWQAVRATRAQNDLAGALTQVRQQKQQADDANQSLRITQKELTDALGEVRRQKGLTDTANASLTQVNRFLTDDLLQSADPAIARGGELTVRQALDAAAATVSQRFADQPLVEASIRHTLATTYDALGHADLALPHARRALELRRGHLGNNKPETVDALNAVTTVLLSLAETDEAEPLCRKAVDLAAKLAGDHPQLLITAQSNLAAVHAARGQHADAEKLLRQALATAKQAYGDEYPATLTAINNVATLLINAGRPDDAEPLLRQMVAAYRKTQGDDHPETLIAAANLAKALQDQGNLAEAEPLQRSTVQGLTKVLGGDHPTTLVQLRNLGGMLEDQGRYDDAAKLYRPALAALQKSLGDDHPDTIATANHLASLLMATGANEEAAAVNRKVLAACRRQLGEDHPFTIMSLNNLGLALWKLQRYEEAEPFFAEAYQRAPKSELDPLKQAYCMARWGPALVALKRYDQAEAPLKEAYRRLSAQELPSAEPLANVLVGLVKVYQANGQTEEAAKWRAKLAALKAEE